MKLYNGKGMMVFPNPFKTNSVYKQEDIIVVKSCYCPNGHNLISERAIFNSFAGIVVHVKKGDKMGLVAICPVYGYKNRVSFDILLKDDDLYSFHCPECDAVLPVYSGCQCGGDIIAFFLDEQNDFSNCIGICSRVGCSNAEIFNGADLNRSVRTDRKDYMFRT